MKTLHLICNAHLDPVWMWDWDDGLSAAVSTFYTAAELAEEFDYVFCHNEALLYEYIEKNDPALFAHIRALVSAGKWKIMGGWYLQPDCIAPSGEALVRQIRAGQRYFCEKFGVKPTVAVNLDSFGHHRSMVQILRKTGHNGYLFCRPMPELVDLPNNPFKWVSADGSEITAFRMEAADLYCSGRGEAVRSIREKLARQEHHDVACALWGVGNHGGGPSRKDLRDIEEFIKESDRRVLHSCPEDFFHELGCTAVYDGRLLCFVKCYSSMQRIKRMHAEIENLLFCTEKICAVASLNGTAYPFEAIRSAEKQLCTIQFHDILSGTCAADGEKSSLEKGAAAVAELRSRRNDAFYFLASCQLPSAQGVYPLFTFHFSHVREMQIVEAEFLIESAIISDTERYRIRAFDDVGNSLPCQILKESSNINYDRHKRIVVRMTLEPFALNRIDLRIDREPVQPVFPTPPEEIVIRDTVKEVRIDRKSGLLKSFCFDGRELLDGEAFCPLFYDDNPDPWGFGLVRVGKSPRRAKLSPCKKGIFRGLENVRITEQGDVLTQVESFFEYGSSFLQLTYRIYREMPYIDVTARVNYNERGKALKLEIPCRRGDRYFAQTPYGRENYPMDGAEYPAHRYAAVADGDSCLAVYNDSVFGQSCDGRKMYLTLLNGAAYCAHPIGDRPILDRNRSIPFIEEGVHVFRFRLSCTTPDRLEREAQDFLQQPYTVNFFPHGKGISMKNVALDSDVLTISAFLREESGVYLCRIFNPTACRQTATLGIAGSKKEIEIDPFCVSTFAYESGRGIAERREMDV